MRAKTPITAATVFCFPSETTVSFILLIIAALFISVNIGQNIERSIQVIFETPGETESVKLFPDAEKDNSETDSSNSNKASAWPYVKTLIFPFATTLILFFTSTLIFLNNPQRIIRRLKLIGNENEKVREFREYAAYVSSSVIKRSPDILITDSIAGAHAQAFGTGFRNFLRLDGGLRILKIKSQRLFDAILFHELGHFMNKDIAKTYFSVSIWYSAISLFALPLVLLLTIVFFQGVFEKLFSGGIDAKELGKIVTVNLPNLLKALGQLILLFGTIIFFRNSVLRSREYYADLRSVTFGYKDELSGILGKASAEKISLWKRFKTFHPTSASRLAVINEPEKLFTISGEMSFFSGVLQSFVVNGLIFPLINIAMLMSVITMPDIDSGVNSTTRYSIFISMVLPFLLFILASPLPAFAVSGSIGLQSIKASYSGSISQAGSGISAKKYLTIPLMFIFGNEVGYLLQPISNLSPKSFEQAIIIALLQFIVFISIVLIMFISHYAGKNLSSRDPSEKSFKARIYSNLALETLVLAVIMFITTSLRLAIVLNFWKPFS